MYFANIVYRLEMYCCQNDGCEESGECYVTDILRNASCQVQAVVHGLRKI